MLALWHSKSFNIILLYYSTLIIFLFCHCYWSLLWYNYWRSLMLRKSTSWSRLKLTVQIQLALHSCNPFLINNRNMTGNIIEKKCFVVLNVKLYVKLRFKAFFHFKTCYIRFSPRTPLQTRLNLLEIFAYPSNKRVTYWAELNL